MTKHYAGTGKWEVFDSAEGQRDIRVIVACGADPNLVVDVARGSRLGVIFNGLGHKEVELVKMTEAQARAQLENVDVKEDPVSAFALKRAIEIVQEQRKNHSIPTYTSPRQKALLGTPAAPGMRA